MHQVTRRGVFAGLVMPRQAMAGLTDARNQTVRASLNLEYTHSNVKLWVSGMTVRVSM